MIDMGQWWDNHAKINSRESPNIYSSLIKHGFIAGKALNWMFFSFQQAMFDSRSFFFSMYGFDWKWGFSMEFKRVGFPVDFSLKTNPMRLFSQDLPLNLPPNYGHLIGKRMIDWGWLTTWRYSTPPQKKMQRGEGLAFSLRIWQNHYFITYNVTYTWIKKAGILRDVHWYDGIEPTIGFSQNPYRQSSGSLSTGCVASAVLPWWIVETPSHNDDIYHKSIHPSWGWPTRGILYVFVCVCIALLSSCLKKRHLNHVSPSIGLAEPAGFTVKVILTADVLKNISKPYPLENQSFSCLTGKFESTVCLSEESTVCLKKPMPARHYMQANLTQNLDEYIEVS